MGQRLDKLEVESRPEKEMCRSRAACIRTSTKCRSCREVQTNAADERDTKQERSNKIAVDVVGFWAWPALAYATYLSAPDRLGRGPGLLSGCVCACVTLSCS